MNNVETDVLIVGGGACGLTSSIILSDLGIDHLLLERRPTTTRLPKAHYINQKTMEIFRQHGLADSVYAAGMPMANCTVRYVTSLAGDGPLDARELYVFDGFGGGVQRFASREVSPGPTTHITQIRLEPILKSHAEKRSPGRVRFKHELIAFEQRPSGIIAQVRECETLAEYRVNAKYMISADGGKIVGPRLGAVMKGTDKLADLVTAHITADLSRYVPGGAMITHIMHPASRFKWGALVPIGPTWGRRSEEWMFNIAYRPDDPDRLSDSEFIPAIRGTLGVPDLPITLHCVNEWAAEALVADRFQFDRIFLAGDAAHRVIPTSGLGLNSATHDAHNLCWKLAAVIRGQADSGLLGTYEVERRPANQRNADWSLLSFKNHVMVEVGLGIMPGASSDERVSAVTEYLSDTPMGRTLRARGKEIIGTQRIEYGAPEIELGSIYTSSAVMPDGSPAPEIDPMGDIYLPTARPGHRLPHAWIEKSGKRMSTHDLTGASAGFSLITGSDGEAWCEAAGTASASLGIAIKAIRIGPEEDYVDATGSWGKNCGIEENGAILVRPDNVVCYRSRGSVADASKALKEALNAILRPNNIGLAPPLHSKARAANN